MNDFDALTGKLYDTDDRVSSAARKVGAARKASRASWKEPPTLLNGWTNVASVEPFGYTKDNDGYIHLKGVVSGGANQSAIFNLPPELRPDYAVSVTCGAAGGSAAVVIGTNGDVSPTNGSGNVTTQTSLSGCMFYPTQWAAGTEIMGRGDSTKMGEYGLPQYETAAVREHLGGMAVALGYSKHWSAPAAHEKTHNVTPHLAGMYRHPLNVYGRTGASNGLIRFDIDRTGLLWTGGAAGTVYISWDGVTWPTHRLRQNRSSLTLGAGVTMFPASAGSNFPPNLIVYKDDMGFAWIGGVVNFTTGTAGTVIATVPVGYLPNKTVLIPANANDTATTIRVRPSGSLELVESVTPGFLCIARGYWPDN